MVLNSNNVLERINASVVETPLGDGRKFSFRAMGTQCQITFYPTSSRVAGEQFKAATIQFIAEFEARYSRFIPESLISQINQAAGKSWVEVDEETDRLFVLCHELFFMTRDAFDPTAMPLIKLWNWKATGRCSPPRIPARAQS